MDEFWDHIRRSINPFDILAFAYGQVYSATGRTEFDLYTEYQTTKSKRESVIKNLIGYFQLLDKDVISLMEFCDFLKKTLGTSDYKTPVACVAIISLFDQYYIYKRADHTSSSAKNANIYRIGPLNSAVSYDQAMIFLKPCDGLFKTASERYKFKSSNPYSQNRLNRILKSYILLSGQDIGTTIPGVIKYEDGKLIQVICQERALSIALVPFTGKPLVKPNLEEYTFTIIGPADGMEQVIIERYKQIIRRLMREKVHIAVFPELALTYGALQAIKMELASDIENPLRLVVCGSLWDDRSDTDKANTAYVVSGEGDDLLTYDKMSPFFWRYKDPETGKIRILREDLWGERNKLDLLEIEGLGRIFITICLDFLSDQRLAIPKMLECNTAAISAYSPSESEFDRIKDGFNKQGLGLFCNCCASPLERKRVEQKKAAEEHDEVAVKRLQNEKVNVGFLALPSMLKTNMESIYFHYLSCLDCGESCIDKLCFMRYDLYPDQCAMDGSQTIRVDFTPCLF